MANTTPEQLRRERAPLPYDDISRTIVVRHIQTPAERLRGFSANDAAESVLSVLEEGNFDYGPVFAGKTVVGRVARRACRAAAGGTLVRSLAEPLSASMLISADTEISQAMRALVEDPWLLVVGGRSIAGVVTPSDLNRQAGRTYFYLLLADLEIRLADVIRGSFPDQQAVLRLLSPEARDDIRNRLEIAEAGEVDSDLVAAMDLSDLIHIGRKSTAVRAAFGVAERSRWESMTGALPDFRHQVMHLTRPMLDDHRGLSRLIKMEERLRALLG